MSALKLQLNLVTENEQRLSSALLAVAARHGDDFEIVEGCKLFSQWGQSRLKALALLSERLGGHPGTDALPFGNSLLRNNFEGSYGLLRDLQDLLLLVHQTNAIWITIAQAAKAMKNELLNQNSLTFVGETDRQIAWLCTQTKFLAPQALSVPAN
jgi:hypothetical protein